MKIYTKIVIDVASGKIIRARFHEYHGPIAECGGGPKISVPGPSEEERARDREQTELLKQQRDILSEQIRQQNLLAPILFQSAGIEPIFAPGSTPGQPGSIVGFKEIADANTALKKDIERGLLERTGAALRGELPVNPALLSELGKESETLREMLRKQLGPGFETSSPGIETLGKFGQRRQELLEAARRGDLTLAESLGLAREASNQQRIDELLSRVTGVNLTPASLAGGLGGVAAGFNALSQRSQQERALQTQVAIANAQARSGGFQSLFGGFGSLAGLVATTPFGGDSGAGGSSLLGRGLGSIFG